jgi:hypothetical protein
MPRRASPSPRRQTTATSRADRLVQHWVHGGFLASFVLLSVAPLLVECWPFANVLVFLQLPAYMLHQYEEHDQDRFRVFFNKTIGKGQDVLSPLMVFLTNVPGVWGLLGVSTYLARFADLGYSLLAVYLVLVNATVHVGHALWFGAYNPGLLTAVALFLPLGGCTMLVVQRAGGASLAMHGLGFGSAVWIHLAIVLHVQSRTSPSSAARRA